MIDGVVITKYRDRLAAIPAPGGGCHTSLLGVANLGVMSGLGRDRIFHDLRTAIPQGQRHIPDSEILAAIHKAMLDHKTTGTLSNSETYQSYRAAEPVISDGKGALQAILKQSKISDEADLWESSPIRLDWEPQEDAGKFLFALFDPDDLIFIGGRHDTGNLGGTIRQAAEWIKHFQNGGTGGPFIIINPLNGLPVEKKTNDGVTYRSDGNVKTFKYCLAEFDTLSREDQILFWTAVKLPLACLIDSGGKSIHAWLKVSELAQVERLEQWATHIKGRLYDQGLIPLGVDSACSNPARLSRLPGHLRDTGKYQRILWLAEPQRGDA